MLKKLVKLAAVVGAAVACKKVIEDILQADKEDKAAEQLAQQQEKEEEE